MVWWDDPGPGPEFDEAFGTLDDDIINMDDEGRNPKGEKKSTVKGSGRGFLQRGEEDGTGCEMMTVNVWDAITNDEIGETLHHRPKMMKRRERLKKPAFSSCEGRSDPPERRPWVSGGGAPQPNQIRHLQTTAVLGRIWR